MPKFESPLNAKPVECETRKGGWVGFGWCIQRPTLNPQPQLSNPKLKPKPLNSNPNPKSQTPNPDPQKNIVMRHSAWRGRIICLSKHAPTHPEMSYCLFRDSPREPSLH